MVYQINSIALGLLVTYFSAADLLKSHNITDYQGIIVQNGEKSSSIKFARSSGGITQIGIERRDTPTNSYITVVTASGPTSDDAAMAAATLQAFTNMDQQASFVDAGSITFAYNQIKPNYVISELERTCNVCDDPGQVSAGERAQDVFATAYLLAARTDVRTDRIAVLGLSHGGSTAIYVARDHEELRPWRERLAARHGKLVASVALYGGCRSKPGYPVIIPLLALLGGRDDWTPAPPCVALANTQANGIMQAIVYPDAYHSFDAASGIEKPHTAYGHLLAYNPAATADAHKRVPEFLYRYLH